VGLAGESQVDDLAFHAESGFFAPASRDDLAVQDHVGKSVLPGPFQGLVQAVSLFSENLDDLADVPAGG
jgi:hypothetical protein